MLTCTDGHVLRQATSMSFEAKQVQRVTSLPNSWSSSHKCRESKTAMETSDCIAPIWIVLQPSPKPTKLQIYPDVQDFGEHGQHSLDSLIGIHFRVTDASRVCTKL
jgi:hypothetical protein